MVIRFTLLVAGTVDSFDQITFKASLAAQLEDISPAEITLKVSAASVRVAATINTLSAAVGEAALGTLTTLAASTDSLSAALGIAVVGVESAPVIAAPAAAEDDATSPTQGGDSSDSIGIIIGSVAGGTVGLLLVAGLFFLARRRQLARRNPETFDWSIDATSVEVQIDSASGRSKSGSGSGGARKDATASKTATTSAAGSSALSSGSSAGVRMHRAQERMAQHEFRSTDIKFLQELGAGSFGTVYQVNFQDEMLAAKRMDVSSKDMRAEIEGVLVREFRALQKVVHTNIVQLLGVVLDNPAW